MLETFTLEFRHSFYYFLFHFDLHFVFFISNSIALSTVHINRSALISFVVPFENVAFEERFNFIEITVKSLLEYIITVAVGAAKEITESMQVNALRRNFILSLSQILKSGSLALHQLGTVKILHGLSASPAFHKYAPKDDRI